MGEKNGHLRRDLNPQPLDCQECALPLCQPVANQPTNNGFFTPDQLSKVTTKYIDSTADLGNNENFYKTILKGLNAPVTNQNLLFFAAWRQAEGGTATNNPFNTTYKLTKDSNISDYNTVGVKNYSKPEYGIEATVKTLLLPYYQDLLQGLRDDIGASNLAAIDDELETWGTGDLIASVLDGARGKITPPDIA